jgi:hypothetical protein
MTDFETRGGWKALVSALKQQDDDRHEVETPEWKEYGLPSVWVRGLTRNQSLNISKKATDKNGKTDPAISDLWQIKWGMVEPALDDVSYNDLKNTRGASRVLQRIHTRISELTGIVDDTPTEDGEAKEGEDDPVKAAESYLKSASV